MKKLLLLIVCLALAGNGLALWTTQYPGNIWNVQTFFKQCDKGTAPLNTSALSVNGTEVINSSGVYIGAVTGGAVTASSVTVSDAAGVKIQGDGDGAITFSGLGNGFDENVIYNLDDTSNECTVTSSSGLNIFNFSSIALQESGIAVLNNDEVDASSELAAIFDDETGTAGAIVFSVSPALTGLPTLGNGATSAGTIGLLEDSDNGTNKVTLAGPASTADVTITLGATAGTLRVEEEWDASSELAAFMDDESGTGALVFAGSPALTGAPTVGNGATSAGSIKFLEDSDNGTNSVTLIGPASTADVTATLPAIDGGTIALAGVDNGAVSFRADAFTGTTMALETPIITAGSDTGLTVNDTGSIRTQIYKVSLAKENFDAAAVTQDTTIGTLPAKSVVHAVYANVSEAFVCGAVCTTATLSATLGISAGGTQFLVSWDLDAGIAWFGDADGEVGSALSIAGNTNSGYMSSAGTAIVMRGTSGTGNWGNGAVTNLSAGAVTFYVLYSILP